MHSRNLDQLLIRALDLQAAVASVAEASGRVAQLLQAQAGTAGSTWQEDYVTSCSYFTRSHRRYLHDVAAFVARYAEGEAAIPDSCSDAQPGLCTSPDDTPRLRTRQRSTRRRVSSMV